MPVATVRERRSVSVDILSEEAEFHRLRPRRASTRPEKLFIRLCYGKVASGRIGIRRQVFIWEPKVCAPETRADKRLSVWHRIE